MALDASLILTSDSGPHAAARTRGLMLSEQAEREDWRALVAAEICVGCRCSNCSSSTSMQAAAWPSIGATVYGVLLAAYIEVWMS